MKALSLFFFALVALLAAARAEPAAEKEFKDRLGEFVRAGDMALVDTIYLQGEAPARQAQTTTQQLEAVLVRRVKKVTFEDISPRMQARLDGPIEIEGRKYLPNLTPYKMVKIEYRVPIKNGSSGYSALTGLQDGRLFIMGYKQAEK